MLLDPGRPVVPLGQACGAPARPLVPLDTDGTVVPGAPDKSKVSLTGPRCPREAGGAPGRTGASGRTVVLLEGLWCAPRP